MNKRTQRKTVIAIGLALVTVIAACVIVAYFAFGANLNQVRVSDYVITSRVGDHYEFSLDTERLIWEQHLPVPPESELSRFPEVAAIRSLDIYVTHDDAGYHFETVSTSNDPSFTKSLRKGGIVLKNTQWTWTENDIIGNSATQPTDGFTELNLPDYVLLAVDANGKYTATLDYEAMLAACAFELPLDPTQHDGYNAIMSLLIDCAPSEGNYRFQTQSRLATIMTQLSENHVRILNTTWTWTPAEMAQRVTNTVPAAQQPTEPQAEAQPAATDAPAVTEPPSGATDASRAITSLYGFDQTAVRVAIRNAKETYYGSRFESGSVYLNYFAVGDKTTEHKNVFRVVYEITQTGGTEYLIADVYDLYAETGYTAGDVTLRTVATRSEARSTEDLKYYTLYTLNGGSMVFPENAGKSPFDENGFVMAKSISEALTYEELWAIPQTSELTLLQLLAYARNEMFARAGHPFDTSGSYYRHFASYSWYEPGETVTASALAEKWPITASNTSTIKFLEKLIKEG